MEVPEKIKLLYGMDSLKWKINEIIDYLKEETTDKSYVFEDLRKYIGMYNKEKEEKETIVKEKDKEIETKNAIIEEIEDGWKKALVENKDFKETIRDLRTISNNATVEEVERLKTLIKEFRIMILELVQEKETYKTTVQSINSLIEKVLKCE